MACGTVHLPGSDTAGDTSAVTGVRRPRLLFLCQTLPFPPDSGVAIRSYNVLRLLSQAFDVTALCFWRSKGGGGEERFAESLARLRELAEADAFPLPQEHSRPRLAWDHLRSVVHNRVYTEFAYQSREFEHRLAEFLRTRRFDLVHVDSLVLSRYLPLLGDTPVVCQHHNVESQLLRQRSRYAHVPWLRVYLRHQARLMEREERRWIPRVALNLTVSEQDRRALERLAPRARVSVVPNGVNVEELHPETGLQDGLVFVGESTWFPNRDALEFLCQAILPRLREAGVEAPVRWVGRATDKTRRLYRDRYGIELTGHVPDVRPFVRDAACYVVPLRLGGGTRIKILEAWAMGKAVVSTSIGCEGLAAEDGRNILIRDTPQGFAQAVRLVLRDAVLSRGLGGMGRRTVERLYSWEVIGKKLLAEYAALLHVPAA